MGPTWGRQIPVVMTESDEKPFLAFLRSSADIQILVTPVSTTEDIYLTEFPRRSDGRKQFFIWNKKFPWEPEVAPTTVGGFYVRNINSAPVIEYYRDPLSLSSPDRGRLYWSKGITLGGQYEFKQYPYAYDAKDFNKWYELVVSWIKVNSRTKVEGRLPVYYLSGAWQ